MNESDKKQIRDYINQLELINIETLFHNIKILLNYKLPKSSKISNKVKRCSFNNSKVNIYPKSLLQNSFNIMNFKDALNHFNEILTTQFLPSELNNFYQNIETLKVVSKNFDLTNLLFQENISGIYRASKNQIFITEKVFSLVIFHELFHMASTKILKNCICTGFKYIFEDIILGDGLNEGYTELLNQRYFNSDSNAYKYLTIIASNLEQIIDPKRMRYLYMNGDLMGLIEDLEKYMPRKKIINFIMNIDLLMRYLREKNFSKLKLFKIVRILKEINQNLIICYGKKIRKLNLNEKNIKLKIKNFASLLILDLEIKDDLYEVLTEQDINNFINTVLTSEKIISEERKR